MRRRAFLAAAGAAAMSVPATLRAQPAENPVIGFLSELGPQEELLAPFRQGLAETGYVEGRNLTVQYRWARRQLELLPELVADLIRRRVALIVTEGSGTPDLSLLLKSQTSTIPIVALVGDPVKTGLVDSLNRPGGNVTGVSLLSADSSWLEGKRLDLLHDVVPDPATIGYLAGPELHSVGEQLDEVMATARRLKIRIVTARVANADGLDPAFASLAAKHVAAILMSASAFFREKRAEIASLTLRYRLPAMAEWRESVEAGILMSYGTSILDAFHNLGVYAGRVLKGEKPAEMPFLLPDKFRLVINLKTAKAIGLTVPPSVLARADEVIE